MPRTHAVALDAEVEVAVQPDREARAGGVGGVAVVACHRPLGGDTAVVEQRLADQLHLDPTVDALDRPHQHVLGVVVGGRARVRRDQVLVAARPHRQGVAHDHPAVRRLPGGDEHVRARLVGAGGGVLDAERAEPEGAGAAVDQAAEYALAVEAGDAQPVDRAVRRDQRGGVAVGQERVVGDRRERRQRGRALLTLGLLGGCRAHAGTHGACQRPCPAIRSSAAFGPHDPGV